MPQLIEQWRVKSADGIAIGFISIWFLGDIANLIGSVWAGLLPEVIFLAVWFCIADFLMISSYFYYTYVYPKHHPHHHKLVTSENEPLLHASTSHDASAAAAISHRRRRSSTLTDIALDPESHGVFTKYVLPFVFVLGAGFVGYFVSGSADPSAEQPIDQTPELVLGPQIVGYISAALYLGARIPQIIQNHKRKSVEGLSLLFFLFSTCGNLTFAGQILFYRSDSQYILLNLSWLLGSLGTIFEDSFIFLQFYLYRHNAAAIEHS